MNHYHFCKRRDFICISLENANKSTGVKTYFRHFSIGYQSKKFAFILRRRFMVRLLQHFNGNPSKKLYAPYSEGDKSPLVRRL